MRHGESQWNLENRFTGWTDIDLTENGEEEAKNAGILIRESNINLDFVYVSRLKRAIKTSRICLNQLKKVNVETFCDWRLNERHYGSLQGLNKTETAKKYGASKVHAWRRSYDISPPKIDEKDKRHPKLDIMYRDIDPAKLPNGESLKDTLKRVKPLWLGEIFTQIKKHKNLMIVAHGNSLRSIVKMLKNINDKEIIKLNIPTGIPYVFELSIKFDVLDDYYLVKKK